LNTDGSREGTKPQSIAKRDKGTTQAADALTLHIHSAIFRIPPSPFNLNSRSILQAKMEFGHSPIKLFLGIASLLILLSSTTLAQDEAAKIDKSRVPARANTPQKFAPSGWKIEEQITGDINGDGIWDYALKLVEAKAEKDAEGDPTERGRALVVALAAKDGQLTRAAVADSLLQCTRCGGAFYGVVETPTEVTIEKGVLVVQQDHGSREVTNTTYRFRYEPATGKFLLIGFDLANADRATAQVVSESINYLTGAREETRSKGEKDIKTRTTIPRRKIYLDDISAEDMETAAYKRLKLY
jgi:hypothetical protein